MQARDETMGPSNEDLQGAELLRHAAWIRRLALGLVGDASLAEDLVQDTWVAALRRRPSGERPLKPWLGTVLRNAARQAFRGQGRRERRQAEARTPEPVAGPEELAERLEMERRLTEELARLAEPFRSTLMLRYYEGLEPSEIARRQGLPAGTVRWRVKRGLDALRAQLDARFGGRAHWSVLFLSLARPPGAPLGVATVAVPGALAMHALTKAGICAAAIVALAIGLRLGGALPDSLWPLAGETAAELPMRPFVPEPEVRAADVADPAESPRREPLRAEAVPAPAPRAAAEPAAVRAVEARVVDELGHPVARARLRLVDPGHPIAATSDADGDLRLVVPERSSPGASPALVLELALSAPGFAARAFEVVVPDGETTHLGTIVLQPGGAISGSVRDLDGRPVADAEVTVSAVDEPPARLEDQRLREAESRVPEGRTRSDGSFTVDGVSCGFVRVWARHGGYLASFSPPVEVRAGQESYGLELVLEPLTAVNRIAGIVLDPDGAPVPAARLEYRHSSRASGITISSADEADAQGRFEFRVPQDTELWLTARDPAGRFGPGSAAGIRTDSGELIVRLTRVESFALRVVDPSGAPVERYGTAVLSADGAFEHASAPRKEHTDGRVELQRPAQPFSVRIDAPGFELALVGPLDPERLPESLPVVLTPVPGLHGRVWLGEEPAAGVEVGLYPVVAPGRLYVRNGFRALVEEELERTQSDAEGRFLLTPREPGSYVVRAERAGSAPAVSAPIEIASGLAASDVQLVLGPGGAIEGRVVRLDGADPAGTIVGLSRADGKDRTVRVGTDGAYRFTHLTPGPWLLVERAEELRPDRTETSSSSGNRKAPEIDWTCQVVEGRTTHHDLVLGSEEACVLEGRLILEGEAPLAWSAKLVREEEIFAEEGGASVTLDPSGAFRVTCPEPGRYWLVLRSSEGKVEQFLLDAVELDWGTQSWESRLQSGSLRVRGAPAWQGEGAPAFVHVWDGPGSRKAFTVVAGDPDGVCFLPFVPAGGGRIVRPDPTSLDFEGWPTVLAVDVPRGGTAEVRLP